MMIFINYLLTLGLPEKDFSPASIVCFSSLFCIDNLLQIVL